MPLFILKLEERILFDAAAPAVIAQAAADAAESSDQGESSQPTDNTASQSDSTQTRQSSQPDQSTNPDQGTQDQASYYNPQDNALLSEVIDAVQDGQVNVLLISSEVDEAQQLAAAGSDKVITVLYDYHTTTLDQLAEKIEAALNGQKADTIGFATDGQTGVFYLIDGVYVSSDTLEANAELAAFWQTVGSYLNENGRVDLLGCFVAGIQMNDFGLIDNLDTLIDSDGINRNVAASYNETSNRADWILEVGNVDAASYFNAEALSAWEGALATFIVLNTNDSGAGSLREAITQANGSAGVDTIINVSSGTPLTGFISLASALPAITDGVNITFSGGDPSISIGAALEIYGDNTLETGLIINAPGQFVNLNGVSITSFIGSGVLASSGVSVTNSWLGAGVGGFTGGNGTGIFFAPGSFGGINNSFIILSESEGVSVVNASSVNIDDNYIGTNEVGADYGNGGSGIFLYGTNIRISGNTIAYNNIGIETQTNTTNTFLRGNEIYSNDNQGILLKEGSDALTIGGNLDVYRNYIYNNGNSGIEVQAGAGENMSIIGNSIGSDRAGNAHGNVLTGIRWLSTDGGGSIRGNAIGSNTTIGILVNTSSATAISNLQIELNDIGYNKDRVAQQANGLDGILIANTTLSGGSIDRNFIHGNSDDLIPSSGLRISNSVITNSTSFDDNTIVNYSRGINISGSSGVIISNSSTVATGIGIRIDEGSLQTSILNSTILSSKSVGIEVESATNTIIQGNSISLSDSHGIHLKSGSGSLIIGGGLAGEGNTILGSLGDGILIGEGAGSNVFIAGNYIGIDEAFNVTTATSNTGNGIRVTSTSTTGLTIGGATSNFGNYISGNGINGILLDTTVQIAGRSDITIQNNRIGTDNNGDAVTPNTIDAIRVNSLLNDSTISENLISGHEHQILFSAVTGSGNTIDGNTLSDGNFGVNLIQNEPGVVDISFNTFNSHSTNAIFINQSSTINVSDNIISNPTSEAIRILFSSDVITSGNFISGGTVGVSFIASSAGRVTGSYITGATTGILVESSNNAIIGGAGVDRNYIYENGTGILISGPTSTNATIDNNEFGSDGVSVRPNSLDGIRITATDATGLSITGNNIRNSGKTDDGVGGFTNDPNGDGIDFASGSNASGATISGNVINNNAGSGIRVNSSNDLNIFLNTIDINLGRGIHLLEGTGHLIQGNTISRNSMEGVRDETNGNIIGGDITSQPGLQFNRIYSNGLSGIVVTNTSAAIGSSTQILSNYIGTDQFGSDNLGNLGYGILTEVEARIGDGTDANRNFIANNRFGEIEANAQVRIRNNYIGAVIENVLGTEYDVALSRGVVGIDLVNSSIENLILNNLIVATGTGTAVNLEGTSATFMDSNRIGVINAQNPVNNDAGGTIGILVDTNSSLLNRFIDNTIGYQEKGIVILDESLAKVDISGNNIGVDTNNNYADIGNDIGILVEGGSEIYIGFVNFDNRIGFNNTGISLVSTEASDILISYNFIGMDNTANAFGNGVGIEVFGDLPITGASITLNTIGNNTTGISLRDLDVAVNVTNNKIGFQSFTNRGGNTTGVEVSGGTATHTFIGNTVGFNTTGYNITSGGSASLSSEKIGGVQHPTQYDYGNTNGIILDGAGAFSVTSSIISGSTEIGLTVISATVAPTISGNWIGTDDVIEKIIANEIGGIDIQSGAATITNNTIRGNLNNSSDAFGIRLSGTAGDVVITGNTIGSGATNSSITNDIGILVTSSDHNGYVIGKRADTDTSNFIERNTTTGISIEAGSRAIQGNVVQFQTTGISIDSGASGNVIGGSEAYQANTIVNNTTGIHITGPTANHSIVNNFIGTDAFNQNKGNVTGILVQDGMASMTGALVITDNTIANNTGDGIAFYNFSSSIMNPSTISNNFIGTNSSLDPGMGNATGIRLNNSSYITIMSNDIHNNTGVGVVVENNSNFITLQSNAISGNGSDGILIDSDSTDLTIGGSFSFLQGNYIYSNSGNGITIEDGSGADTSIQGNTIGVNTGDMAAGNLGDGIRVISTDTSGLTIGGTSYDFGNVIGNNGGQGIELADNAVVTGGRTNLEISYNYIGTDRSDNNFGNFAEGIFISTVLNSATLSFNVIKGQSTSISYSNVSGDNNRIRNNTITGVGTGTGNGILITGSTGSDNQFNDNTISDVSVGLNIQTTGDYSFSGNDISSYGTTGIALNASDNSIVIGGTIDGGGTAANGVLLNNGADGNTVQGVEILNTTTAVRVASDSIQNTITQNSIYANTNGIELAIGTNESMLAPDSLIASFTNNTPVIDISGSLTGVPDGSYTIEFFDNIGADLDDNGRSYIGSTTVVVTGGTGSYNVQLATSVPVVSEGDHKITATATNASGSTSKFSSPAAYFMDLTAPSESANIASTLSEGGLDPINLIELSFNDNNATDGNITYTVTAGPMHGTLLVNGSESATFTQQDIVDNLVSYQHNNSENFTDSIDLTVSDDQNNSTTTTLNFSIDPVNDAPVITVPGAQSVLEDGSVDVTGISIDDTDVDQGTGVLEVNLSASDGVISLADTTGLTLTGGAYDSSSVTVQGSLLDLNSALATVTYAPNLNFNGQDSLNISVSDLGNFGSGGSLGDSNSITIDVTSVNDAPTAVNSSVSTLEDNAYTFQVSDFDFTDSSDDPANALQSITISNLNLAPGSTLKLGSTDVFDGQVITVAEIPTLVFNPAPDDNGANNSTFDFAVTDDGGTVNPGADDTSANAATMSIDVESVNDAPEAVASSVSTPEDTAYMFSAGDFGISDPNDSPVNALQSITITNLNLASGSTLKLGGTDVFDGQSIDATEINTLVFTPADNANGAGYSTFDFFVVDDGGTANAGAEDTSVAAATMTIDVESVNNAPTAVASSVSTNEDTAYTFSSGDFGFSDPNDSPANALQSIIISNLNLASGATLKLSGADVINGQTISEAQIASLVFTPVDDANGLAYSTFDFSVVDDGGTANLGSEDTSAAAATMTIDVNPVNDAPVNTVPPAQVTAEDVPLVFSTANGNAISVADVDGNSLTVTLAIDDGILTLGNDSTGSINAGNNSNMITLDGTVLQINQALDGLTYTPSQHFNASSTLTLTTNDTTAPDVISTVVIDLTPFNNPPVLNDVPVGPVNATEDTDLVITGIDITDVDVAGGTGEVEVTLSVSSGTITLADLTNLDFTSGGDGQLSMTFNGALADVNAALASITYRGDLHFNGMDNLSITVSDLGNSPGPAETATANFDIDVAADNDAPTITAAGAATTSEESQVVINSAFSVQDVDINEGTGEVEVTLSVDDGVVSLAQTTGLDFNIGGSGSGDGSNDALMVFRGLLADVNAALTTLTFTPDALFNSEFTARDAIINITVNDLGNSPTSAESDSASIAVNVDAVNNAPVLNNVPGGTLTPAEETDFDITGISISDADVAEGDGQVQVSLSVTSGTLNLATISGLVFDSGAVDSNNMTFTGLLADVNNALATITYKGGLDYNGADTLNITVSDLGNEPGSALVDSAAVNLDVTAVNDAPQIETNNPLSVNEGGSNIISSAQLVTSDIDNNASEITYTLDVDVANGRLELSGVEINAGETFTQEQIDNGDLVYIHNSSETTSDSFQFSVTDNIIGSPVIGTFDITIQESNDAPTLTENNGVSVNEDGTVQITSANLLYDDSDSSASQLIYTITGAVTHGELKRGTNVLGIGDTFTQNDINNNQITYEHDGLESTTDSFDFELSDGLIASPLTGTFDISINPINDAPSAASNTITINEDNSHVFSAADFGFSDPNDSPANSLQSVVIETLSIDADSTLTLGGSAVSDGQVIAVGAIPTLVFTPGADENGGNYSSFTFHLIDDGGTDNGGVNASATETITFDVTEVNDAPSGADNTVTTLEDTDYTFQASDFGFSDVDGDQLASVIIKTLPGAGSLTLDGNAVNADDAISLADINNDLLKFVPGADENGTSYASFTFSVVDDSGSDNTDLSPNTMTVDVTADNDAPANDVPGQQTTAEDTPLTFEGSNAITIDDVDGDLLNVTISIDNGILTLGDALAATITSGANGSASISLQGSAAQINEALDGLVYTPTADFNGTSTLTLVTSDSIAPSVGSTVEVVVTAVNDPLTITVPGDQNLTEDALSYDVDGISFDDPDADLAPSASYSAALSVNNGVVTLGDPSNLAISGNGSNSITLSGTQADINAALLTLTYQPNLNFNGVDTLTFSVDDSSNTGSGDNGIISETVTLNVAADNDAPVLEANTALSVVEGGTNTIGAARLAYSDVDNTADQIVYTILDTPINGALFLDTTELEMSDTFTQDDINNGRLSYEHDGSETTSDTFTFQVSDGAAFDSGTFTINVLEFNNPPSLVADSGTVAEGSSLTLSTAELSYSDPDTSDANIVYTVTSLPASGTLIFDNGVDPASNLAVNDTFTQQDIVDGTISYQNNGDETTSDSFGYSVVDDGFEATPQNGTFDLTITRTNDAPVLTVPAGQTTSEDVGLLISGITFTDADEALDPGVQYSVALQVTNGTLSAGSESGSSILLTGTRAELLADLAGLAYTPTLNYSGADTLTVTVDDGGNTGSGATGIDSKTVDITVTADPDTPDLVVDGTASGNEDTAIPLNITASLIDLDGSESLTVTISDIPLGAVLSDGVETSANNVTSVDVSNWDLSSLTVTPPPYSDVDFTLTITAQSEEGSTGSTANISETIAVTVDPVLSPIATSFFAASGDEDTPIRLSFQASLFDQDGSESVSYELTLLPPGSVLTSGTDTFTATAGNTSVDVTGWDLNNLFFQPPENSNGSIPLTIVVTQREAASGAEATYNINLPVTVAPVNDTPIVNVPADVTINEDANFSSVGGITVSDIDNNLATDNVITLSVSNGLLSLGNDAGVTGTTTNNSTLQFTGTIDAINTVLQTLVYLPNSDFYGADTLNITFSDSGNSGSGGAATDTASVVINVNPVNDQPTITAPIEAIVDEGDTLTFGNVVILDIDNSTGNARVTLTATHVLITLDTTSNLTVTGDGTNSVTIEGTIAAINAALDTFYLTPTDSYTGSDSLTIFVNDLGNTGGGVLTDSYTLPVTGNAVNDAPYNVTNTGSEATYNIPDAILSSELYYADPEQSPSDVTYLVDTGPASGYLQHSDNSGTAISSFTQADLDAGSISYVATQQQATADSFSFSVSDGQGGSVSNQTFNLSVEAISQPPTTPAPNQPVQFAPPPTVSITRVPVGEALAPAFKAPDVQIGAGGFLGPRGVNQLTGSGALFGYENLAAQSGQKVSFGVGGDGVHLSHRTATTGFGQALEALNFIQDANSAAKTQSSIEELTGATGSYEAIKDTQSGFLGSVRSLTSAVISWLRE